MNYSRLVSEAKGLGFNSGSRIQRAKTNLRANFSQKSEMREVLLDIKSNFTDVYGHYYNETAENDVMNDVMEYTKAKDRGITGIQRRTYK